MQRDGCLEAPPLDQPYVGSRHQCLLSRPRRRVAFEHSAPAAPAQQHADIALLHPFLQKPPVAGCSGERMALPHSSRLPQQPIRRVVLLVRLERALLLAVRDVSPQDVLRTVPHQDA